MLPSKLNEFLNEIYSRLDSLNIETSSLTIDHIAYQANSSTEYDSIKPDFEKSGETLSEEIVGGRRVGIFKLMEEISYRDQNFDVVELIEPKEGQEVKSGWEHVEMLTKGSLEEFMQKYPDIQWEKDALERDVFPMLILKLNNGLSIKFPRRGAEEEVGRIKNMK